MKTDENLALSINKLNFSYNISDKLTLQNINFNIKKNEFISIIGHNGSGKSTLSKLISGILKPQSGSIFIEGIKICEKNLGKIRKKMGIIFQNPDNQFIGTTVYDDIEFGLQNYLFPREKMKEIIYESAKKVNIEHLLDSEPSNLSGGQKQKVAIATIFALKPNIVIFDESTSMLDPLGKIEINKLMHDMKKKYQKTVISITHDMDEAIKSDRMIVMNNGRLVYFDKPQEIFLKYHKELETMGLSLPNALKISLGIKNIKPTISEKKVIDEIKKKARLEYFSKDNKSIEHEKAKEIIISSNNLNYYYLKKFPGEKHALNNVSSKIYKNKINAIVGNTGSGKSTFVQHINYLIKASSGSLKINIEDDVFSLTRRKILMNGKRVSPIKLRSNIGLAFQFPEYQLFNPTVEKEIIFAPINFGMSKKEAISNAKKNILDVNLGVEHLNSNPFELSGGQKRKVALASIISYSPKIIIFDEPTAGLDPFSTNAILDLIVKLKNQNTTIIIISHEIDQLLSIADNFTLFKEGKIVNQGSAWEIFSDKKTVKDNNLKTPYIYDFLEKLSINKEKWKSIINISNLIENINKII